MAAGLARKIDAIFSSFERSGPGCAVAVFKHGRLLYQRGYGLAHPGRPEKIGARTLFNLGSVSKHVTAFCVLLLEERGLLSLDDRLLQHFPELPKIYSGVRLRHLLRHRSGIRCIESLFFSEQIAGTTHLSVEQRLRLLGRQRSLNFKPGTAMLYCNTGYVLLAELLRRRSGLSLAAFAQKELFGPLGMDRTRILEHPLPLPPGAATGCVDSKEGIKPALQGPRAPGPTDVWSCLEDWARWERNFFEAKVGSHSMIARLFSPFPKKGEGYGGGFFLWKEAGHRLAGHGGYDSGFRARYTRDLDSGYSAVTLCNLEGFNPYQGNQAALLAARGGKQPGAAKAMPKPRPSHPPKAGKAAKRWAAYAGLYNSLRGHDRWLLSGIAGGLRVEAPWGAFEILEEQGKLRGQGPAFGSSFEFKDGPGPQARLIERKAGRTLKSFAFLGKPSWKVPNPSAYTGYYRSPETGLLRALALDRGRLRSFNPLMPRAWLQWLAPGRMMAGPQILVDFKFGPDGKALELSYDFIGGRTTQLRYVKLPPKDWPFYLPKERRADAIFDQGMVRHLQQQF